jgi:hypothetical protein
MTDFFRYNLRMKTQTKRAGRPKKSSDQLQTEYLDVRLTEAEKAAFKAAADLAGMAVSAWVRGRLRQAATRELGSASRPVAFLERQT